MKKKISKLILASSLLLSSVGYSQSQRIEAVDNVAVKMGVQGSTAVYLAMEVLGKLDSKQRAEKLMEEENNLKLLQLELTKEEAKLAAAQKVMLENNFMQTTYSLTTPILIVTGITGGVSGFWSTVIYFEGDKAPRANKVFWTSAVVASLTYATKKFIGTEVNLQRDQVAQLKSSVENIKSQANKIQEVIEILRKFYRIDVDVNVKVN